MLRVRFILGMSRALSPLPCSTGLPSPSRRFVASSERNDDRGDPEPLTSAETNCLSCSLALLVLFKPMDDLVCQGGIYPLLLTLAHSCSSTRWRPHLVSSSLVQMVLISSPPVFLPLQAKGRGVTFTLVLFYKADLIHVINMCLFKIQPQFTQLVSRF